MQTLNVLHYATRFGICLIAILNLLLSGCGGGGGGAASPQVDTTPPTVSSTSPASSATGVAVNTTITSTFSEPMDAATVSTATFMLNNGVTGTVTYNGTTAIYTPSSNLAYSTTYSSTITTGEKDAAGNAMASPYTWTFTTGVAPDITPLNDTGITSSQCYQASSNALVACNSAGALALNKAQDGMAGRDADAAINSYTDGKLGFSFTSVTGGCVLDNVNGLMWEVKTTDGGLRDWNKTYTNYSATYDPYFLYGTATDASGFVSAVNATNLCGYSDWRLPSADELQSIVDYGIAYPGPTIDTTWLPNTKANVFWSATPTVGYSAGAWVVYFSHGLVDNYNNRIDSHHVRLVRVVHSQTLPRYTVSANGQEVTDNQTKLIWRRCAEGMVFSGGTCMGTASTFTHEAALQQAKTLASSTRIAWRLPNIKELSSIADKNLSGPAIDSTAFPATPVFPAIWVFWSASPYVGDSTHAWVVDFSSGVVDGSRLRNGYSLFVRLVRDGQ